jgi:hypothetical protein
MRRWVKSCRTRENGTMTDDPLERLRAICLALPDIAEKLNHGMPSWVVRGRTVVQFYYGPDRGEDVIGMWVPAPPGVLEAQVNAEPDRFYQPPYGGVGWLGVRLDRDVDWDEVASIATEAYRMVAPKHLVAKVDGH